MLRKRLLPNMRRYCGMLVVVALSLMSSGATGANAIVPLGQTPDTASKQAPPPDQSQPVTATGQDDSAQKNSPKSEQKNETESAPSAEPKAETNAETKAQTKTEPDKHSTPRRGKGRLRPKENGSTSQTDMSAPRKVVVREGGASEPAEQIVTGMTPEEAQRKRQDAEQLLGSAGDTLRRLASYSFSAEQQETVLQIRSYMVRAQAALKEGDLSRGHTLALKASLLADDLEKR